MLGAPKRGPGVRDLSLVLPPGRMPRWIAKRPLKRWRYVGIYTSELMVCVGDARIGPVPQRWWAVATPDGKLAERTTFGRGGLRIAGSSVAVDARDVSIDLRLEESAGVEIVSPVEDEGAYIWTRKQAGVPVRGTVEVAGRRYDIDAAAGFIDDSAGYHARHTTWNWSAGVGMASDGRAIGWNLVEGIHDDPFVSERTIWIDGEPQAVGPVTFAEDLSEIASEPGTGVPANGGVALRFSEWSTREHSSNAVLMRSTYRQPFGTFTGTFPGIQLATGYGVMEHHDVTW
jgi:hypothetical protein